MRYRVRSSVLPQVVHRKFVGIRFSKPQEASPTVLDRSRTVVNDALKNEKILSLALRVPLLRAIHTFWVRKRQHYADDLTKTIDMTKIRRWEDTYAEVLQTVERGSLQAVFGKKDDAALDQVLEASSLAMDCFQRGDISQMAKKKEYQFASDGAPCDLEILRRWRQLTRGPNSKLEAVARKSLVTFGVGHFSSQGKKWDPKIYQIYLLTLAHMNRSILDGVDSDLLATGEQQLVQQLQEFVASLKG